MSSSVQTADPPEAAGPGTADESGVVHYGQTATRPRTGGTLPLGEPPEAAGPAVETSGGGLAYGRPGAQAGPMPVPSQAEREREAQLRERLMGSCQCAVIPGGVLAQLAELATVARLVPAESIGCPRCRAVPQQLVGQLVAAIGKGGKR
jgi:hypothetical protein